MPKIHGLTMLKQLGFGAGLLGGTAATLIVPPAVPATRDSLTPISGRRIQPPAQPPELAVA
ncbi:hypothetical protein MU0083_000325 [[Mycobacterium] kokjensenii]|uniref:Uncharacterized protein n=1 Tax=[Mycobacterium] kokjensenii TaxID=3064287 RepID=A0ABN9MS85_9MYCO|nr:hypothetical protein [Mycolicibacter sp. MU0083]CAJ1493453.1 hypothetical protein MU0083_000325 [Mycolicibacter sp. MU0083]